jgi:hypothetical protein
MSLRSRMTGNLSKAAEKHINHSSLPLALFRLIPACWQRWEFAKYWMLIVQVLNGLAFSRGPRHAGCPRERLPYSQLPRWYFFLSNTLTLFEISAD